MIKKWLKLLSKVLFYAAIVLAVALVIFTANKAVRMI